MVQQGLELMHLVDVELMCPEHDDNVLDCSLSLSLSARSDTICPACDTNFNKDWVACDRCYTWFYVECTSIPLEMYSKIDMTWFCSEYEV